MAFVLKEWEDAPSINTPISAEALKNLETRLSSYADVTLDVETQARIDADNALASGVPSADFAALLGTKADLVSGFVPSSQLPAVAITDVYVVASQSEMLGLTAQTGDVVVRTDILRNYVHNSGTEGTLADWTELLVPTGSPVVSVNSMTGAIILGYADVGAAAASHTHAQTDITGLTASLAAKADTTYVDSQDTAIRNRVVIGTDITASRDLVSADAGKSFDAVSSAAIAINVPLASAQAFTAGDVILVRRGGTGAVTVTKTVGVTLDSDGGKVAINATKDLVSLQYRGSNVWWLYGALA